METELISSLSSVATLLMLFPVKPKYCEFTGLDYVSTEQAAVKKRVHSVDSWMQTLNVKIDGQIYVWLHALLVFWYTFPDMCNHV